MIRFILNLTINNSNSGSSSISSCDYYVWNGLFIDSSGSTHKPLQIFRDVINS